MTPHTAQHVRSTDPTPDPLVHTLSAWQQDQFERHCRYARSLGLDPEHASRFAMRQIQTAKPQPEA